MFVKGSFVQTKSDGTKKPVELLRAGDTVFDPVSWRSNIVVRVLSRDVALARSENWRGGELFPVEFEVGDLGPGLPDRRMLVSPQQPIVGRVDVTSQGRQLVCRRASDITDRRATKEGTITYYAVFLADNRPFIVDGITCMGISDAELASTDEIGADPGHEVSFFAATTDVGWGC